MIYNLVHNLCESLVENIGGVAGVGKNTPPTPVTYLTQWKIVGNSEVHTDPYLTSWKVSGNSVVDNNTILSCGDLGQDGKYHVKISNGVDIYDIALTEPLRKVNNVADTIEFPSGTEGKALVTRNIQSKKWNTLTISYQTFNNYDRLYTNVLSGILLPTSIAERAQICLSADFTQNIAPTQANVQINPTDQCMCVFSNGQMFIRDTSISNAEQFVTKYGNNEFLYLLATPTTELVDAPQIAVSPTDTYTSANVIPYSVFEYKKNVEIWSCGEYSAVDGKWHILVQPQGGSIADIALTEPLRKVNDVADTIEFPSDTENKALVTRNIASILLGDFNFNYNANPDRLCFDVPYSSNRSFVAIALLTNVGGNIMVASYENVKWSTATNINKDMCIAMSGNGDLRVRDLRYNDLETFKAHIADYEMLFLLATPTTELVDVPQIEEADSYTCVISQGAKAVSWSSFETN